MKLIAIFVAGLVAGASGAATPVDLKFKISGPDGPLANFSLRASYRTSDKTPVPAYANTDHAGETVFHFDRDVDTEVEITVGDPSDSKRELTSTDKAASDTFRESIKHLGLPAHWFVRLPENAASIERVITVPRARSIRVQIPDAFENPHRLASLGIAGFLGGACSVDRKTHMLTLDGVPVDQSFTAYFTFDESEICTRSIAVPIPAGSADTDLPQIAIEPVAFSAFVLVEKVADPRPAPPAALGGMGVPGVTLISSNGQIVVSGMTFRDKPSRVPVPPGTYYYAPAAVGPEDFQVKLIQKLVAGADLSAVFPHVTVAAGETKTLQVNPVDILYKIYELP